MKSLEAKVTLVAKDKITRKLLAEIDRLDQLFIVSKVDLLTEGNGQLKDYEYVQVYVEKYDQERCDRCWVVSETVGKHENHPDLCERCADIVEEYY